MKKYFKIIMSLLLIVVIMFGGSGCMGKKADAQNSIKEKMYSYACEKYSSDFEIVDFIYALRGMDAYRSDVLTLSDGDDFIFNVTHSPQDVNCVNLYDDYYSEVLEQKFSDYLIEQNNVSFNLNTVVMLDQDYTNEELESLTVPQLVQSKGLMKLIIIAVVQADACYANDNLSDIYTLYENVCKLKPKYLDFQFVVTSDISEKLTNCIDNPRMNYENDWDSYDNIIEYLSIDEYLLSIEEFEYKIIKV